MAFGLFQDELFRIFWLFLRLPLRVCVLIASVAGWIRAHVGVWRPPPPPTLPPHKHYFSSHRTGRESISGFSSTSPARNVICSTPERLLWGLFPSSSHGKYYWIQWPLWGNNFITHAERSIVLWPKLSLKSIRTACLCVVTYRRLLWNGNTSLMKEAVNVVSRANGPLTSWCWTLLCRA